MTKSSSVDVEITSAPFDWRFVWRTIAGVLLGAWFIWTDSRILFELVLPHDAFGGDGLLYSTAARAWLSSADPWAVSENAVFLAAPPPTLLPFVLTAWATEEVARSVWVTLGFAAIAMTVRVRRLPWWCFFFPPAAYSAMHGSIETIMVACIVIGPRWLAPVLKIYAVIPLAIQGSWRDVFKAGIAVAVTVPILPWSQFIAHLDDIGPRLVTQTSGGYSAAGDPRLIVATIAALFLLDRQIVAYAAVPALWPNTAQQYGALLLPIVHRTPFVAVIGVLPSTRFVIPVAIILEGLSRGLWRVWRRGRRPRAGVDRSQGEVKRYPSSGSD